MKTASILVLIACIVVVVLSFSLRDLYNRIDEVEHPDGHRLVQKESGFGSIDEIGSIGNRPIVARQDGPNMFLDDNGIPVQQNL